jgi:hypothetical protein
MTMGEVERGVGRFDSLSKFLADRHYASLKIKSRVLENTGHSGTKSETFGRGLQFVFERPALKLDASVLSRYAGSYKTPDGNTIEIKDENNGLALYFSRNNKYMLYAASESDFYSTNEFFNLHFRTGNGNIEGFQLDRYGNSQFIRKNN